MTVSPTWKGAFLYFKTADQAPPSEFSFWSLFASVKLIAYRVITNRYYIKIQNYWAKNIEKFAVIAWIVWIMIILSSFETIYREVSYETKFKILKVLTKHFILKRWNSWWSMHRHIQSCMFTSYATSGTYESPWSYTSRIQVSDIWCIHNLAH